MRRKYGRAWKRIRDRYAKQHPKCEKCGNDTEEIHHIIPICKGGLWYDENLMALCKKCHSEIHRRWKDEQYD